MAVFWQLCALLLVQGLQLLEMLEPFGTRHEAKKRTSIARHERSCFACFACSVNERKHGINKDGKRVVSAA